MPHAKYLQQAAEIAEQIMILVSDFRVLVGRIEQERELPSRGLVLVADPDGASTAEQDNGVLQPLSAGKD